MKEESISRKCMVIAGILIFCSLVVLIFKERVVPTPDLGFQVSIPRNEQYEREISFLKKEIEEYVLLENTFGAGVVDIQHYQEAFDDQAFLWSGFFWGRYSVKYTQPLKRLPSGRLVAKAEGIDQSGVIVEVEKVFRDAEGKTRILYGEQRQFSVKDLYSFKGNPVGVLKHLGIRFKEGNVNLKEFSLNASGL